MRHSLAVTAVASLLLVSLSGRAAKADAVFSFPALCSGTGFVTVGGFGNHYMTVVSTRGIGDWCTGSANYVGGGAFFVEPGSAGVLVKDPPDVFNQGVDFRLISIDLAPAFVGENIGGLLTFSTGTHSQTFSFAPATLPNFPAWQTFFFDDVLRSATSLQFPEQGIRGQSAVYQFNNIVFSVVPEPGALALVATGLIVIAIAQRGWRDRSRSNARS